jgi:GNAT superfamily N-acetyltransferase
VTFTVRRAGPADAADIAAAHRDSIIGVGAIYYEPGIVNDWAALVTEELYVRAMSRGERFFIATSEPGSQPGVLGFSSHRVEEDEHRTAVYVRSTATRRGVGSALFNAAEAAAIAAGAASIHVDASLAAVAFYRASGFEELGHGEHPLPSGRTMACVFMRKILPKRRSES